MAFSSNLFSMSASGSCLDPTTYDGADLTIMDWADWLDGSPSFTADGFHTPDTYFTLRIAVQSPATSSQLFVIAEKAGGGPGPDVESLSVTGKTVGLTLNVDMDVNLTTEGVLGQFLVPPPPTHQGPTRSTRRSIAARPMRSGRTVC